MMKLRVPSLVLFTGLLLFFPKALHSQTSSGQYAKTPANSVANPHAEVFTIPEGTTGLSPLAGSIESIESVRVPINDTVTGAETRVTLKFTLKGCLDQLMPVIYHPEVQERRATIYITALNAHNQQSMVANCVAMPQPTAQVTLPGIFKRNQIGLVFMGERPQQHASYLP